MTKRYRSDDCQDCGSHTRYVDKYDRFACDACDRWTDEPCGCLYGECEFDPAPEKPSMVPAR